MRIAQEEKYLSLSALAFIIRQESGSHRRPGRRQPRDGEAKMRRRRRRRGLGLIGRACRRRRRRRRAAGGGVGQGRRDAGEREVSGWKIKTYGWIQWIGRPK